MSARRGFFDECHVGEIDPGYFYLFQNGKQVGEVWAQQDMIDVILYDNYLTPGKVVTSGSGNVTNPNIYTEFVYKLPITYPPKAPMAPSVGARIAALTGARPFTHTNYKGSATYYP